MLQASTHQGATCYKGNGRQCMAMSVAAVLQAFKSKPISWSRAVFDDVIRDGDQLYNYIIDSKNSLDMPYLKLEDIPKKYKNVNINISDPLYGTIGCHTSDIPFYSLKEAILSITKRESISGCIFTMGKSTPSYTSAVIRYSDQYFFVDSHSRSESGMVTSDGFATMTSHESVDDICFFIRKLANSIFEKKPNDVQFELAEMTIQDDISQNNSSSESEFSGFEPMSEGEYSCLLYMAQQANENVSSPNLSDDSSSVSIHDSFESLDSAQMNEAVDGLNDSTFFLQNIDVETFKSVPTDTDTIHVNTIINQRRFSGDNFDGIENTRPDDDKENEDCDDMFENIDDVIDKDYEPDDDEDDDEDDDLPLAYFCKRKNGNVFKKSKRLQHQCRNKIVENVSKDDSEVSDQTATCAASNVSNIETGTGLENVRSQEADMYQSANSVSNLDITGSGNVSVDHLDAGVSGRSRDSDAKRGRKRRRDPSTWKRAVNKKKRNLGQSYFSSFKKETVTSRTMNQGCGSKCRYRCKSNFSEGERESLFHSFWKLGEITKQWQFLEKFAAKKPKANRKCNASERRKSSIVWSFPSVHTEGNPQVCKTFFLDTLCISDQMVRTAHGKKNPVGLCENDSRGCHSNRQNRIADDQKERVRRHINSFKAIDSHYCRKDTKKQYLPAGLNVKKMYRLFCQAIKENEPNVSPVSLSAYRYVFDHEFNLSFHKPIKDRCDFCSSFDSSTEKEKEQMQERYDKHLYNKAYIRTEKEKRKLLAKSESGKDLVVACFDLEQVLVTPKSFESSLYYKRRLNSYNFTLYELGNGEGSCYIWNESMASRGSNEIASCVYNFIKSKVQDGKKRFIFFSDNCCGQNKNKNYVAMLWYCMQKFNLISIDHKYLIKGHTQNENDSIHAAIESAAKSISIYTTGQWAATIRAARPKKPYVVNELNVSDFFDFKEIANKLKNFTIDVNSERVYWNEIKTLSLSILEPEIFKYQVDYDGTNHSVNLFQRQRYRVNVNEIQLQKLYPEGIQIARAKFCDLVHLCRSGIIPSIHHSFYILLPHEPN